MKIATSFLIVLPLVLAGCGSGSSRMGYDATFDRIDGIGASSADQDWTNPSLLPTSGTALYEGGIYLDTALNGSPMDGAHDLGGEMTMTVDFGSETPVTGSATNFVDVDDRVYGGALVLSESFWDASFDDALVYRARLDGELTDLAGQRFDLRTDLEGSFLGASHDHVTGFIGGDVCTGGDCTVLEGGFIGERK